MRTDQAIKNYYEENERLLLSNLSVSIVNRLKGWEDETADAFEKASVMFADIVGFTRMSLRVPPVAVVGVLNQVFTAFDRITAENGVEKVKAIGDAYMAVCGLPNPVENHPEAIAEAALGMVEEMKVYNERNGMNISICVGFNCGPVVPRVRTKELRSREAKLVLYAVPGHEIATQLEVRV